MPQFTIIVPTFNESGNIRELLRRLERIADRGNIDEVIFVDDSIDNTPHVIREASERSALSVRLIHRAATERSGGLFGAVVTGIHVAASPWVLVMDADLQHPPEDVPRLMAAASVANADVVVASRYCGGGDAAGLGGRVRRLVSSGATTLAALLFPSRLRGCSDSMTGFFALRRDAIDVNALRPRGFKVLLEILVRHQLNILEVPFTFAARHSGNSKASVREGLKFLLQLIDLRWQMWWSTERAREMATFGLVGTANVLLDVGIFNIALRRWPGDPTLAKAISAGAAMITSYFMNRHWTWRDHSPARLRRELPLFILLSSVGLGVSELCLEISTTDFGSHRPLLTTSRPMASG